MRRCPLVTNGVGGAIEINFVILINLGVNELQVFIISILIPHVPQLQLIGFKFARAAKQRQFVAVTGNID
jgi:hypothetical protein